MRRTDKRLLSRCYGTFLFNLVNGYCFMNNVRIEEHGMGNFNAWQAVFIRKKSHGERW